MAETGGAFGAAPLRKGDNQAASGRDRWPIHSASSGPVIAELWGRRKKNLPEGVLKSISTWATYCGALVSAMHFIKRKRLPQESSFFRIPTQPIPSARPRRLTPSFSIHPHPISAPFFPTILIENPPVFLYNESKYYSESCVQAAFPKA